MKIKNITIGIRSPEQVGQDFIKAFEAARRGHPFSRRDEVYFTSVDAMRKVLTQKRVELLHAIREKRPDSVYELAQLVDRDLKNVQEDVGLLSRIGLVSLSRSRTARARVIPRVEYDNLRVQIPVI